MGNALMDVYANSRNASSWLTRDIRCAAQVVSSYTSGTTYTTSDHVIVLMVPSIDAAGSVLSSYYDHIVYKLQGTDLYRIVIKVAASSRANDNRIIAHNCESLTFSSLYKPSADESTWAMKTLSFYNGSSDAKKLSTINTISIYLPINKSTVSLSGMGTADELLNPTTVVRLRNK
jgi:hypothetical protein